MAAAREYVRTLTVRSREEGAVAVAQRLHAVADAQRAVTSATEQTATAVDISARKMADNARAFDALSSRLEGNSRAFQTFARDSRTAQAALDAGRISITQYSAMIAQLRKELEAAGSTRLGFTVDQSGLNGLLGVRANLGNAARESAAVFEDEARLMDQLGAKAKSLRAELDPLGAAYDRLQAQLAEYQQLAARQLITTDELALGTARAREAFDKSAESLRPLNDNVKLTSNQVTNLGYQLNDVATMAAMGASPFAILSSQAGQVVQALGEGPQGVRGSLKAIGTAIVGAAAAIGPFGWGLAAATAAAGGLFFAFRDNVPDMTSALEGHRTALDGVEAGYDGVASAISRVASQSVAVFNERQSRAVLELASRASLGAALRPNGGIIERSTFEEFGSIGTVLSGVAREFEAFKGPIADLQAAFAGGQNKALEFQHAVAELANLDPTNEALREAASTLIKLTADAAAAQAQLDGLGRAFDRARERADKFNELAGELGGFIPDRMTDAQRIEQTYQQMMRLATTEADVTRAQDLRRLSLEALSAAEAQRRGLYELDYQSITARTAAERANIEYQRVKLELTNEGISAEQAELQAREAGTLSYQRSVTEFANANRSRLEALNDNVAAAKAEVDALGMSEGAAAAYSAEMQALTEYRRAAAEAGLPVDPAEEAAIRQAAAALGAYTDQLKAATEAKEQLERTNEAFADLAFERSIAGLSEREQEVREFVRQVGVEYESATGQKLAAEKRFNIGLQETQAQLEDVREIGRDAFLDIVDALASGESAVDSLIGAFASLGKQLASLGAQKLFDNLFGGGEQSSPVASIGAVAGAAGALAQVASRPVSFTAPAYSAGLSLGQTYAAPIEAVERSFLPALSKATTGLTAAAKAIRTIESGSAAGNYGAMGPVTRNGDRAYGAYQVMGNNIPEWSKAALGRVVSNVEFLSSPKLQDAVFEHRFGGYMAKYGPEGASRAWFAGEGGMKNYKAQDVVGTSVGGYGSRFGQLYAQHSASNDNVPAFSTREMSRAVSDGNLDATRRIATGAVPGFAGSGYPAGADPWSSGGVNLRQVSGGATSAVSSGGLFGPRAQAGFGVLGAGLGAFSQGYESGSPFSGGLSGALGGYQAGGAISSFLGVGAGMGAGLGIVGGAALGIIGGILGARKKREQEHRQKADAWAQMQPDYIKWQSSIQKTMPTSGLSDYFAEQTANFDKFRETGGAAWKYGTNNSTQQFQDVGTAMYKKFHEIRDAFRETIDPMIEALNEGRGMDSPFADARNQVYQLGQQLLQFIDDTQESLAYRPEEQERRVAEARAAAIEQAKQSLDFVEPLSALAEEVERFEGAALGTRKILMDLGMAADDAGTIVDTKLTAALSQLGENLERDLRDQIDALDGKAYLASFRDLIDENLSMLADIAANPALNVDTSLVETFFAKSAQSLVDGAELAGGAFEELIRLFPQLAGVVTAFNGTVNNMTEGQAEAADRVERAVAARAEAENALRAAYERTKSEIESTIDRVKAFQDSIRDFMTDMRLDSAMSTLDPTERLAEAKKLFDETSAKALAGDEEAQGRLLDVSQKYLDESLSFHASTQEYYDSFEHVRGVLEQADTKAGLQVTAAQQQLDQLKAQVSALISIDDGVLSVEDAIVDLNAAIRELAAAQAALNGVRDYGTSIDRNKAIISALEAAGYNYTGNFGGGAFDQWFKSLSAADQAIVKPIVDNTMPLAVTKPTQNYGAAPTRNQSIVSGLAGAGLNYTGGFGSGQFGAWVASLPPAQQAAANAIANQYTHIGYASGGYTGPGAVNDVAGIVHRGEVVWSQRDVARWGGAGAVDAMRTMRLPQMPTMSARAQEGRDTAAVVGAIERLERRTTENAKALGQIMMQLSQEERTEAREAAESARRRSASTDRIAGRRQGMAA